MAHTTNLYQVNQTYYFRCRIPSDLQVNKRVSEDIVVDVGEDDKIIGIEIMDASRHVALDKLLPVNYKIAQVS